MPKCPEAGLWRCDAEVGGQREPEPATHSAALHGHHDRERLLEQSDALVVQVPSGPGDVGDLVGAAEVRAGAEVLAGAAQHDGACPPLGGERLERVSQCLQQVKVEEVRLPTRELERGDVVGVDLDPKLHISVR